MEPWALDSAAAFKGRMAFVEKDVESDGVAAKYGVRGTPTFILIDANGKELARFGYEASAAAFTARIEQSLAKATP